MPNQKMCRICKTPFTPIRPMQTACSMVCAIAYGKQKGDKDRAKQEREERRERRDKLAKARMTLPKAKALAQKAINAYVRERDSRMPCISCAAPLLGQTLGGSVDAGHFRSVGSAPHLRYNLNNIHAQCKRCNRYLAGNYAEYAFRLPDRIGKEAFDALMSDQRQRHYSTDQLLRMASVFNKKTRRLKNRHDQAIRKLYPR